LVISDLGRIENERNHSNAGILLAKEIRKRNAKIPIIIFSTKDAIERYNDEALNAGVNYLTNSTIDLFSVVALEFGKAKGTA
jgi:CheY-like chemotaxis protein